MVRSGMALSIFFVLLLFLPPSSGAQVAEGDVRTHTVAAGETLTSIAASRYGDAGEWRRILAANEDRIEDADRIQVGMELVIPPLRGAAAEARMISRVEVRPGGRPAPGVGTVPDGLEPEEAALEAVRQRQALARYSEFEPNPAPGYGGERTVFFQHPALARQGSVIHASGPEDVSIVPREIHRGSGWLLLPDEELESLGSVPTFAGDQDIRLFRTTVQHRDLVRGVFNGEVQPRVGEEFLIVRVDREIDGVGTVVVPTGVATVRRLAEAGAVLEVVREYGHIELHHHLVPNRELVIEPGVEPEPTDAVLEARILAFEREREIQLRNDRAFLDVGRAHGVRPGDEFVVLLGAEDGWEGRVAARLQVVDSREETSTVRVLTTTSRELQTGLTARLDRRMP